MNRNPAIRIETENSTSEDAVQGLTAAVHWSSIFPYHSIVV